MDFRIIDLEEIKVVGIKARTSNEKAEKDIEELWERFYSENIIQKISDKLDNEIISIYTEYEGDHTKPYSVIIGCKVKSFNEIDEHFTSKVIPSGKYAVINVEGELPKSVVNAWQQIWNSDLQRKYGSDFELYKNNVKKDLPKAEIYIGII